MTPDPQDTAMTLTITAGLTASGRAARTARPAPGHPPARLVTWPAGPLPDRSPPGRQAASR